MNTSPRRMSGHFFSVGLIVLTLLRLQQQRIFVTYTNDVERKENTIMGEVPLDVNTTRDIRGASTTDNKKRLPVEVDNSVFNYTAYWERAMQAALESLNTKEPTQSSSCPKVYIYDLPSSLRDSSEKELGFGKKVILRGEDKKFQGLLYNTNQYAFPSILEERIKKSKLCRTKNPNNADLFFVPIFVAPKGLEEWKAVCSKTSGQDVVNALPYLNATNACRHFLAFGKGHYVGEYCPEWFSNPIDQLKPLTRLAYSHVAFDKHLNGTHSYTQNDDIMTEYPNLYSVPYPSSLHFTKSNELPQFKTKRRSLMSYIGKTDHGDTLVRKRIQESCQRYKDKKVCAFVKKWATKHATFKSKATFCLEPAGDSPWRKSLADSISFGCIPVLFSQLTDDVAPWHWNDWKAWGRVLVPRDEFIAGHIDLKRLLQSIPLQLLELMQSTLNEKARRFQYSVDDDQEDGIRVILDGLYRQVKDRERQGTCGYVQHSNGMYSQ